MYSGSDGGVSELQVNTTYIGQRQENSRFATACQIEYDIFISKARVALVNHAFQRS
jgi:hypothetical protein